MTQENSWPEKVRAAKSWPQLLEELLDHDVYLIHPFSKIREHPIWIPILERLRQDKDHAVALLITYLENFDVLGQWSLILLPMLTGENPVPESFKDADLVAQAEYWIEWAERNGIEPL